MRRPLRIALIVLAVIVVILIVLPFLINADQFRPKVEAEASKALGREVKVGHLSLSLLSGGVKAEDLSIAENPTFGKEPFLTAKSMAIGVDIWPLITSKKLNVRSFTIDSPAMNLIHGTNGKWNVSTLGGNSSSSSSGSSDLTVGSFAIKNGKITVIHQGTRAKPAVYKDVNLEASDISQTTAFPLAFSAEPPGGGSLKLDGKFGPMAKGDVGKSPLAAKLKISKLDLGAAFADPESALRGLLDLDGTLNSDGRSAKLAATGTANKLVLSNGGSPATVPVGIDLGADYNLARDAGTITKGVLKIGKSTGNFGGTFDTSGASPRIDMKLDAGSLAVSDVEGLLPALGVLPSGANLKGGTLSLHANSTGPSDALVTSGNATLQNSKLTGYDLSSSLATVAKLAGMGSSKETDIQLFTSDFRIAPTGTQVSNMKLIAPQLGTLTGGGTISPKSELNFKMQAELKGQGSAIGVLQQAMGKNQGNVTVPFMIAGTTSNPKFVPDVGGAVGGMLKQGTGTQQGTGGLVEGLGGLFGKKKKQ